MVSSDPSVDMQKGKGNFVFLTRHLNCNASSKDKR